MRNVSSYIWGMIGKLGPQIIYLITTIILSRFLTPSDFGKIGVLAIFTSVSQTLLEAGLGGSLIKEKEITDLDCSTIFVYNIIVSFFLYVIIFIGSPYIETYFNIPGLKSICRCLCLVFVINSWGQIAQTLLFKELQFKVLMWSSLISVTIGSIIAIVSSIWLKWGVYSLIAYQLSQSSVYVTYNWWRCNFKLSFRFSIYSFKRLFSFGFFTTINGVVDTIYENIITSIFGKYLGVSKAGYLTQAKRIETASIASLSGTINSVAFPILTKLKDNKSDFIIEANSLLKNLSLIILPLMLSIAFFSDAIIQILFGTNWIEAAPYLKILMWTGCVFVLEAANRNFLKSLGKVKILFVTTLIKRMIALSLIFICIKINVGWLLYTYFLGSIIGYISNSIACSKALRINVLNYLWESLRYVLPPLLFYVLCNLYRTLFGIELISNILGWIILILCYYILFLPQMGINLINNLIKKVRN